MCCTFVQNYHDICGSNETISTSILAQSVSSSRTINPDAVWSLILIPIRRIAGGAYMRAVQHTTLYIMINARALIASIFQAKALLTVHAERDRCRGINKTINIISPACRGKRGSRIDIFYEIFQKLVHTAWTCTQATHSRIYIHTRIRERENKNI